MVFDAQTGSVGPDAGRVHCRLSWSPDGLKDWQWVDQEGGGVAGREFIPHGAAGAFDSHVCFGAHLPTRMPDGSSRIYFMGGNGPHNGLRNSSLGLATAPPDRFASVSGTGATTLRAAVNVTGAALLLTADVQAGGSVVIGVVGEGAAFEASAALTASATDHVVVFPGAPGGLAALVGKAVVLSLRVQHAAVYTFGFKS
jgi:hypothetical protein